MSEHVQRLADDINRRLEPQADAVVTPETEALYVSMSRVTLEILRAAFKADAEGTRADEWTRRFCRSRVELIDRILTGQH